jgi:hypothetical protein
LASEFSLGELFANSDGRIRPHAPVSIPHRLSARPIAIGLRRHIHRRRSIVTRGGNRSADDSPRGEATNEPSRNVSAACTHWRSRSTGERQRHRRWQKQKSCHVLTRDPNIPGLTVALISNQEISSPTQAAVESGPTDEVAFLFVFGPPKCTPSGRPLAPAAWRYSLQCGVVDWGIGISPNRRAAIKLWEYSVSPIWLTNAALYAPA